jgi:hypothetical protein
LTKNINNLLTKSHKKNKSLFESQYFLVFMNKIFINFGFVLCTSYALYAPPSNAFDPSDTPSGHTIIRPTPVHHGKPLTPHQRAAYQATIATIADLGLKTVPPKQARPRPNFGENTESLSKKTKNSTIVFRWLAPEEAKTNGALKELLEAIDPKDNECCTTIDLQLSNIKICRALLPILKKLVQKFPALETIEVDSSILQDKSGRLSRSGKGFLKFFKSHNVEVSSHFTNMMTSD